MDAIDDKNIPSREKYWDELEDLQKIERLHQALNDYARLERYISALLVHQHEQNAGLLVPINITETYHRIQNDSWL